MKPIRNSLRSCWLGHVAKRCGHPNIEDMGDKWTFCEDVGCTGVPTTRGSGEGAKR